MTPPILKGRRKNEEKKHKKPDWIRLLTMAGFTVEIGKEVSAWHQDDDVAQCESNFVHIYHPALGHKRRYVCGHSRVGAAAEVLKLLLDE